MPSPDLTDLRDRTAREVVASGTASLVAAVARDGEIVFEEGFGWADRARGLPASVHVPYSIASITKPITATALLQLVEDGLVDLDAPIETYLRGARLQPRAADAAEATVGRVANHTAGLPLHYQFFYDDEPFRPPARSETMRRYATLVTPPGERFQYSNLGYGILDLLISEVSGRSYADVVRRRVFEPLGMHRSSVGAPNDMGLDRAARYGADGVAYPFYDFDHPGGSAVFASAHDLLRFAMATVGTPLDDQRSVLPRSRIDQMTTATAQSGAGYGYGIGWSSYDNEAGFATFGHTGGMGGVSTVLAIVPSERIAVVALANVTGSALPQWFRVEALSTLLPRYAAAKEAARTALRGRDPGEPPPDDLLDALGGRWEGTIDTYAGSRELTLDVASGDIRVEIAGQLRTLLNRVRWDGQRLSGTMFGDMGTDDARKRPHHIALDLRQRDDVLDGVATALTQTPDGEGGSPGRRAGNALSHWVRLERPVPRS